MIPARKCDLVIAGAGPAGLAAALYLLRTQPALAGRIVAIERARHPRAKVCAGGLIPRTTAALDELGVGLPVPAVTVFGGIAETEVGSIDLGRRRDPLCTIVRRDEFDAMLAQTARDAGLEIIEETRVLGAEQTHKGVLVATDSGRFEGRVLLGADGSGSRIRTAVFGRAKHNIGRALMADVPVAEWAEEFVRRIYRFDFNCVVAGVDGYCWSFPCLIDGQPHLNLGIYEQNPRRTRPLGQKPDLLRELRSAFPAIDSMHQGSGVAFKAFPIRWYEAKDRYVRGSILLAGDAAGGDPLMGEGISYAFEHGKLAAAAIARFLNGDHSALNDYDKELHNGLTGRKLRRLAFAARRFYGRRHRLYFRLVGLSSKAQQLGVDWYNGAQGTDELSVAQALWRLGRAIVFGQELR
jgi:flavin-dependent dehydrogenase